METTKIKSWFNSYSAKMIVVSLIALLLLIPTIWIQDIIRERISMKDKVERELASLWGNSQLLSGPVLNVPFTYLQPKDNEQGYIEYRSVAHFLPEKLDVESEISPEIRYRGIYKMPVYQSRIKLNANFNAPDFSQLNITAETIKWDEAYFTMGISDLRGVKNNLPVKINSKECNIVPGVQDNDLFSSGITIKTADSVQNNNMSIEAELLLNGSSDFMIEPLGKTSNVKMQSTWENPSFTGSFLPTSREITKDGFTADWTVTHINRNFPQQWTGKKYKKRDANLGVELLMPIDHYQKATRSVKYAILFIALNFIVFLFIEIRNKKRIHPFQYSLVAFALLLFYTLLTSVSEQIGFNAAYVVSAVAITGLISWYSFSILKAIKPVVSIMLLQIALYVFLFTILQLQDYALLMGSIGLLVILGIIMKASQKIKWYNDNPA